MKSKCVVVGLAVGSLLAITGCGVSPSKGPSGFPPPSTSGNGLGGNGGSGTTGTGSSGSTPTAQTGYSNLVFSDNFSGTSLDSNWNNFMQSSSGVWPANWNGPGGNYLNSFSSSQVSVNNGLTLSATESRGSWVGGVITSTRYWDGGYFQVKAKMPSATATDNGAWPAIWMLPAPGQPSCDAWEIDNFEGGMGTGSSATTADPYPNDFSWHTNAPSSGCASSQTKVGTDSNSGIDLGTGFHTYGLAWVPGKSITWYLDGKQIGQITSSQITIPNEPMELILNLGVASSSTSSWHSYPGETPPVPTTMTMQVSGVQVWQ